MSKLLLDPTPIEDRSDHATPEQMIWTKPGEPLPVILPDGQVITLEEFNQMQLENDDNEDM